MKVLFVTRKYPPQKGGMELYCYNLIANYSGDKDVISLGKKQIHLLWFLPYCCIRVLLCAKKYDVICIGDMLMSVTGFLARLRNPRIKVVAIVHGLDITYKRSIYQWYLRVFSKKFDMYVPNSSYTAKTAEKKGYGPLRIIFPATLKDEDADRDISCKKEIRDRYAGSDELIMITVGRLVKRKGAAWFVENVLPGIDKRHKYRYYIVGEGEERERIERAIAKTNNNNISMPGRVSDEELDRLYRAADIFVMPNIMVDNDVEGYGMVAVEAAANGCIVVASDIQGITDAVEDGITGYLIEAENAERFADRINDIFTDYKTYSEKTAYARKLVYERCTGTGIAKKFEELFKSL